MERPKEKDLGVQGLRRLKKDVSKSGKEGRAGKVNYPLATLLNGDRLSQITWLIHIRATRARSVVREQL